MRQEFSFAGMMPAAAVFVWAFCVCVGEKTRFAPRHVEDDDSFKVEEQASCKSYLRKLFGDNGNVSYDLVISTTTYVFQKIEHTPMT